MTDTEDDAVSDTDDGATTDTDDAITDTNDTMTDESDATESNSSEPASTELHRRRVPIPEEVPLPRMLDFYELQGPEHTGIHEFYDNLRAGELTTTRCRDCEALHFPPRIVCPECTSEDLAYVGLPHEGELYAFTEVRGGTPLGVPDETPFVVAIVDLGEVQLSARIDDATYDDLEIGDPVSLTVVEIDGPTDEERVFYRFAPTTSIGGDT